MQALVRSPAGRTGSCPLQPHALGATARLSAAAGVPRRCPQHRTWATRRGSIRSAKQMHQQPPPGADEIIPMGPTTISTTNTKAAAAGKKGQWSQRMAAIQELMSRCQEQLQAVGALRTTNPALAQELKTKAEQHLERLMQFAELQQQQHIAGSTSDSELQQLLQEVQLQLTLEQEAARTAASSTTSTSSTPSPPAQDTSTQLQQHLQQAEAEVAALQQQLADYDARLEATMDELHDHRELQMVYDKQCQDMYKLRMQLQQAQHQGHDAVTSASQVAKQHKQDLAWLMQAHQKELSDAHRKHQELILETQQLRIKLLEQEQLIWSQGTSRASPPAAAEASEAAAADDDAASATAQQEQKQQLEQEQEQEQATQLQQQQQEQEQEHEQEALQAQLMQLQEAANSLASEKQQLQKALQDMKREQAVLRVELQHLREASATGVAAAAAATEAAAAAQASSTEAAAAAVAAARAEGAAAAGQELQARMQAAEQQRENLSQEVKQLQAALAEALEAKVSAAAAEAAAVAAAAAAAPVPGPLQQQQQQQSPPSSSAVAAAVSGADVDAAVAVQQLKVVKLQMAELRTQLAGARRELRQVAGRAEAAEAALQQQAASYEARLAKLQAWYGKQAAVVAALRKGKALQDGQVGFTNTNRFWVPDVLVFEFLKHWVAREALMQQQEGFLGLQVQPPQAGVSADGGVEVLVSSLWDSIPSWEAWAKSGAATQQHMPVGCYQYVPAKGEGFPEAFVPFREYDEAVNAKY